MKIIVVLAAFAALATAAPAVPETDRKLLDIIGAILNHLNRPPISVGPAIIDESPISVGPAIIDESPISVGPAIIDEESPISVGPAIIDEDFIHGESPITLPAIPVEDSPITIEIPGGPTINIVINVNSAPQHEEIEPTPVIVVDDLEAGSPVVVDENIEPTPVLVVDDFAPDADVYY